MNGSLSDFLDLREIGGQLQKIRASVRSGIPTCVFTPSKAERTHIAWGLDSQIVYVCSDRTKALEYYERFKDYFDDNIELLLERDDLLLYRKLSQMSVGIERYKALYNFATGKSVAMVTTMQALLQYYLKRDDLLSGVMDLTANGEYNVESLIRQLIINGYSREEVCENKGEFSVKGDIVSIYPSDKELPLRITFWDTLIESIKEYDPDTMKAYNELDSVKIFPCGDIIIPSEEIDTIIAKVKKSCKGFYDEADRRVKEIISEIQIKFSGGMSSSASWLLPFLSDKLTGIEEYFNDKTVLVFDEPKSGYDQTKLYYNDFLNRFETLIGEGEVTPNHKKGLRKTDILKTLASDYKVMSYATMASANPLFAPEAIYTIPSVPVHNYYMNFNSLFADIRNFNISGYRVIICCGDERTAKSIKNTLYDNHIYAVYTEELRLNSRGVMVTPFPISYGFNYKEAKLIVIGRNEIIKKKTERKTGNRKKRNIFTMPKCGDYVVHDVHGIGLCAGITQIKTPSGSMADYVVINYAGADQLFVAIDQMDRLQKYSGSDTVPKLSKIGGKEFQKLKDKVKESVKEMAFDLLELYTKRQNSKGFKYSEDTVWQKEFEDSFEYTETEDQLKAISEIKADMEKGIVMDRLLCGDVGYGKTEVALRAMFKTVMDGKQAALLAPTTILARQHFNTAMERFGEFKLKCVLLSRFQSKEEIKKNIEMIASGQACIIIATHRLLSQDVKFKDLGLLVLDEEQRFGVEHKEKLKAIQNNINVLTLSATPIPRTLNMALTGIRDISVLETPPKERVPVQTYVSELTDGLLADAINRELARDGQVFVLYNRVNGIEGIAARIKALAPMANVIIGHGQMGDRQLEDAINQFYNKEANVLVCTTIIENGIDLPDANTLIVCDADKLGLSALYQLRGRVGRSDRLAYAYFTTKQGKVMTSDAMKRLNAILDYTDFGSGFKIAMRDLEIRGAGNVLGKEQHGHIAKVGYDMYCKLLQEAVAEISGTMGEKRSVVEMQVDIDAYLDSDYISGNDEKIKLYKEIAEIKSIEDAKELKNRLTEHYGAPDSGLLNLMDIALIKNMASDLGAVKIVINEKSSRIMFTPEVYQNQRVIFAISDMSGECTLTADSNPTLIFTSKTKNIPEKIQTMIAFLLNSSKKD